MKTLQQEYAGKVYLKVTAYGDDHDEGTPARKKYGSMALKLPVLVRSAGLCTALAFVDSQNEGPYNVLLADLAAVVGAGSADNFLVKSREDGLPDYLLLTRQTLAALEWFRRFAQSVLGVKTTDDPDEASSDGSDDTAGDSPEGGGP